MDAEAQRLNFKDLDALATELERGNGSFVPADKIAAFTSEQVITQVLRNQGQSDPEKIVEKILRHQAKRLFLLAAGCGKFEWLVGWLECSKPFSDLDLPVELDRSGDVPAIRSISTLGQRNRRLWPTGKDTDRKARTVMVTFESDQWALLAPVFTKTTFHYELHESVPLPFNTKKNRDMGGWFSTVYEVELHWAHQDVIISEEPKQHLKVALKEMNKIEDECFMREMKVLEVIRGIQHPHLIRPIASYRRGPDGRGCFLFPWAHKGNLKTFWARKENQKGVVQLQEGSAYKLMMWTLNQMLGLCSALAEMHKSRPIRDPTSNEEIHCRHGDIKPENILVFSQGKSDVLCIADIGLGKYHAKATDFRRAGNIYTETTTGTTRYLPPEFSSGKQIPRVHDVWSLGCLLLEFIIWAAWGNDGLNKFIQLNIVEFWQRRNDIFQVHQDVEQWIQQMRVVFGAHQKTSLGDVLDMVHSRMLVIEKRRGKSQEIQAELEKIVTKAESDEEYCLGETLCSRIRQSKPPSLRSGSQNMGEEYKAR